MFRDNRNRGCDVAKKGSKKVAKGGAKKSRDREPGPELAPLQVRLYTISGSAVGTVDLPPVFAGDVRVDLIRRAVTAFQANRRQPYGAKFRAGMRHSVRW